MYLLCANSPENTSLGAYVGGNSQLVFVHAALLCRLVVTDIKLLSVTFKTRKQILSTVLHP